MNLKAKVEQLEEKAGIKKHPVVVVQMDGETKEEALQKANVPPGSNVILITVSFE
jgi:hypothetical protein